MITRNQMLSQLRVCDVYSTPTRALLGPELGDRAEPDALTAPRRPLRAAGGAQRHLSLRPAGGHRRPRRRRLGRRGRRGSAAAERVWSVRGRRVARSGRGLPADGVPGQRPGDGRQ